MTTKVDTTFGEDPDYDKVITVKHGTITINEWGKVGCIATMPLVFLDDEVAKKAQELQKDDNGATDTVKISGRIVTRFDRRPGVDNAERYAPYTQIEVQSIA